MSDTHKERHATLRGELQERLDLRTTYELLDLSTAPTGSYWYGLWPTGTRTLVGCISVNNNNMYL